MRNSLSRGAGECKMKQRTGGKGKGAEGRTGPVGVLLREETNSLSTLLFSPPLPLRP